MGALNGHFTWLLLLLTALITVSDAASITAAPQHPASPHTVLPERIFIIGDGTPASCTQTEIQDRLATAGAFGGGTVVFRCGADPLTIDITGAGVAPLNLPDNTILDGGGRITLRAVTAGGPALSVDANARVVVKNLTIAAGGGLVEALNNAGTLTLANVTMSGFSNCGIMSTGSLHLLNTTFSDNGSFLGSVVQIRGGTALVDRSVFIRNNAMTGGAIANNGNLTVTNSMFSTNLADIPFGGGGAIANVGTLTIEKSRFSQNTAGAGGAVASFGVLDARDSIFSTNHGSPGPGGIASGGSIVLRDCEIVNNTSDSDGGGLGIGGAGNIRETTFTGNRARHTGGGIFTSADDLTIRRSLVIANDADVDGGGIFIASGSPVLHQTVVTANSPNDIAPADSVGLGRKTTMHHSSDESLKKLILQSLTVSPAQVEAWRDEVRSQVSR
jgi:predicted outer membrane repeat protein